MKHRVFGGVVVLIAALSLVGGLLLRSPPPVEEDEGRRVVREAARKTTALAAIFVAAAQLADADQLASFEKHGIVLPSDLPWLSEIEERFPERRGLVRAVERWPKARKRAALEWLLENTTWSTMLHAMAIESFDAHLRPREWGPSMSVYAPEIHARRASLAPLLEEALEDEAIRRIAEQVAVPQEPFTPEGVQQKRDALLRYLRFEEELPEFHAFRAPLMGPGLGVNAVLPDGTVLMVVGPSWALGDASLTLFHEMAHQPVHRILVKPRVDAALASSACAFSTVARNYGYSTWGSYFAETLVRSLSYRLEKREAPDSDFPFERPLTEMLAQWEETDRPFDEAVLSTLHGIRERACEADAVRP